MTFSSPMIDWDAFMPVILVVVGGVLVLMWDVFFPRRERSILVTLTLAILAAALGTTLSISPAPGGELSFGGMYLFDGFTRFVFVLLLFSSFLVVLISAAQSSLEEAPAGEYFSLILFATAGMMVMAGTQNLLMIFVGLETLSLSLYVLACYLRREVASNEAGLKYLLLGSFASGFLLYGMAMVYGATGSMDLAEIAARLGAHSPSRSTAFLLGLGFLVVGLGFKVAAVPFNMWTPDVYEGAPTAVTAFISVGPKAAAFAAFFRLVLAVAPYAGAEMEAVLWTMAVLTMTLGNIVAIWQENVKRMLAYSSIAHAGYLLMALVAARGSGSLAVGGFLYYMLVYVFMNLGAFCVVVAAGAEGRERLTLESYAGLSYTRPAMAVAMAVFMFSLAGLPPTGGFVAKFNVFSAVVKAGYVWLAVFGVLNSVISLFYYGRLVVFMYMREPVGKSSPPRFVPGGSYAFAALLLGVVGTLHLGIFPSPLFEFALRAATLP